MSEIPSSDRGAGSRDDRPAATMAMDVDGDLSGTRENSSHGIVERLSPRDLIFALIVVTVWGSNFVVVHWGLQRVPPLTLAALRFLFSGFPAVLLVRRPRTSLLSLAGFGICLGVGQFGLLFLAMRSSITPALAALVLQMQAFFTVLLAAALLREALRLQTVFALLIAGAGIALIAWKAGGFATPAGLMLVLLAALAWAACNLIARSAQTTQMLAFVAWSSVFATPPLIALALLVEGPRALLTIVSRPDPVVVGVVFWQSAANTLLGYGLWNWLLNRYSAAQVAPLSLLVPVIAMAFAWLLIGEALQTWKLVACVLVLAGLATNQLGAQLSRRASAAKRRRSTVDRPQTR